MKRLCFAAAAGAICLAAIAGSASAQTFTYGPQAGGAIPDNSTTGISSTINVTDTYTVGAVNTISFVGLNHTWVGDLIGTITHNGVTVDLFNRTGSTTATGFGTNSDLLTANTYVFALTGTNLATTAAAGSTIPSGTYAAATHQLVNVNPNTLSSFAGTPVNGAWTLLITDNAGGDTGSYTNWSLNVTSQATGSATPDAGTLAMCAAGLPLLGYGLRRRRKAA